MSFNPNRDLLSLSSDIADAWALHEVAEHPDSNRVAYENVCRAIEKVGKRHICLAEKLDEQKLRNIGHDAEAVARRCSLTLQGDTINEIVDLCVGHNSMKFSAARYPKSWNAAVPSLKEIADLVFAFKMLTKLILVRWSGEAHEENQRMIAFFRDERGIDIRGMRYIDIKLD